MPANAESEEQGGRYLGGCNFVSFAAFGAELAHAEKSHTHSITHPAYLMPWEPKHLHFRTTM